jgi:hypothetical protein
MANINVTVVDQNNVTLNLTPPTQNTITIDRGITGQPGVPGESNIGGYPITLGSVPQNYDALMFLSGAWTNIPQTEIADGGNF